MGQFPTNSDFITRAQVCTPTNTLNPKSAWTFENQSGSLGTCLNGSVIYVGTSGDINVITAGSVRQSGLALAYGAIVTLSILSGGSGYTSGVNVNPVISTSSSPPDIAIEIVDGNGAITEVLVEGKGAGFVPGQTFTMPGGDNNALFRIDAVEVNFPNSFGGGVAREFKNVPSGTILPVCVDYVLSTGTTATDLIAGK
jgi:hypothetical protein